MLGIGVQEGLIIAFMAVLLFGAPALTFIVGYALGKKKAQSAGEGGCAPDQPESPKEIAEDE